MTLFGTRGDEPIGPWRMGCTYLSILPPPVDLRHLFLQSLQRLLILHRGSLRKVVVDTPGVRTVSLQEGQVHLAKWIEGVWVGVRRRPSEEHTVIKGEF